MLELFKLFGIIGLKGVDKTKKDLKDTTNTAKDESSKLEKHVSKIGELAPKIGKLAVKGVAAAGAAIGTITKFAVSSYSEYEQLAGGVETLFGAQGMSLKKYAKSIGETVGQAKGKYDQLIQAQTDVMNNAKVAYKTAGMSANDYMNTITSFAAALKQSTANETEAAKVANMAVIDMADNANKMGTNMEDIQNAYQGFSKQNYTMLDNLKLGYGGTKSEMERLLQNAEKLTGVHYDINNLSDVYKAINAIQGKLGITGTTGEEAMKTIDGAMKMTKASWDNLLTGLADPKQAVGPLISEFTTSLGTLAKNVTPKIKEVFNALPNALIQITPQLMNTIIDLAPSLILAAINLVAGLIGALPGILEPIFSELTDIFNKIPQFLKGNANIVDGFLKSIDSGKPSIAAKGIEMITALINAIINSLPIIIQIGAKIIDSLGSSISSNMPSFLSRFLDILIQLSQAILTYLPVLVGMGMKLIFSLVQGLMSSLPTLISKVPTIIANLANAFSNSMQTIFVWGVKIIAEIIKGLVMAIPSLIANIPKIIYAIFAVWNAINWWNLGKGLISGIAKGISGMGGSLVNTAKNLFNSLKSHVSNIFNNIKNVIQSPMFDAKTKVLWIVKELQNGVKVAFNFIKSHASSVWNGIKSAIMSPMSAAANFVKAIINKIKGFFNFKISWPHIPLPHFNIKPNGWNVGDLLKGKIPSLGVKWYAQAMDNPMILDAPTIFGMSNGQMLGAGEAGAEVVAGRDTLMKMINQASNNRTDEILEALHRIIALLSDEDRMHDIIVKALNDGSFVVMLDGREVGRIVRKYAG
nr:MAG TPA: tail tape measure protein [Caudoviricetes sp.]